MKKGKPGPTREQCTDEQWSHVCRFFDYLRDRAMKRRLEQSAVLESAT